MDDDYKPLWPQFRSVTPASVTDGENCICLECKHPFKAKKGAKFCGQNCRQQASRRKKRVRRMATIAVNALKQIESMVHNYPDVSIVASLEVERVMIFADVTLAGVTHHAE